MAKRIAVKDLRAGSIEATPIDTDWGYGSEDEGYPEKWDFYSASRCDKCGKIVLGHSESEQHSDADSESECDGYVSNSAPMMNYRYPVDKWTVEQIGCDAAAEALVDLPLVLVEFTDDTAYYLALTGGGMDLSWEICEAYTRLGLLPPIHFCGLPRMADRGNSARDRYIVSACRESIRVQMGWLKNKLRDLRGITKASK